MTLRSLRKPPITARSSQSRRSDGGRLRPLLAAGPLVAILVIGLVLPLPSGAADTDRPQVVTADYVAESDATDSSVRHVSHSAGTSGGKLVWRPVRPTKAAAGRRPAERVAQHAAPRSNEPRRPGEADPFDDPFGDIGESGLLPPANLLSNHLLTGSKPEPLLGGSLPPLSDEKPPYTDFPSPTGEEDPPFEIPSLDEALAAAPPMDPGPCPTPDQLKPLNKITQDISAKHGRFPRECGLGDEAFQARAWAPMTFTWKASGLCHKPAYFEQVALERYGHSTGPYTQPLVSGAHFFLTVPILPYKMGLKPPGECLYTLGYYRPGSCAPYLLDPLPLSLRAALAQGAATTGLAFLLP